MAFHMFANERCGSILDETMPRLRSKPPCRLDDWNQPMKLFLSTAVLAGACSFSVAAPVTGVDWGLHGALESASVQPTGMLDNTFLFTLASEFDLFSEAVSNNRQRPADLKGGLVSLFRHTDPLGDLLVGSYTFDGSTEGLLHAFGRLAAGDYHYWVSGMGTGANGGAYTIRSTVQGASEGASSASTTPPTLALAPEFAVAEPQSGTLALAALAALALLLNRRKFLPPKPRTRRV